MDIIITNNKLVADEYKNTCTIMFVDGGFDEIATATRDMVHKGHRLLSHPLSGSVKPNENPYKSILIDGTAGRLDLESLQIIEGCIAAAKSFPHKQRSISEETDLDFKTVDRHLITSAFSNKYI